MEINEMVWDTKKNEIAKIINTSTFLAKECIDVGTGYRHQSEFLTLEQCYEIISNTTVQDLTLNYKK